MFKCQFCGTQVPRGVPSQLVVTEKREIVYAHDWVRVSNTSKNRQKPVWRELPRSKNGGRYRGKPCFIEVLVPTHVGWEIAREKRACIPCAMLNT